MSDNTFNNMLVKHCSPVLAGIKTANMFTFFETEEKVNNIVKGYNKALNSFGIYFYVLNNNEKSSLIYVYRLDKLKKDLQEKYVKTFMTKEGYDVYNPNLCIDRLSQKIKEKNGFPHEIGLFLSYPICDVLGFIKHKGNNFKYCGFWKVYGNETKAKQTFCKYEKCTNLYCKRFNKEKNLLKLIAN